MISNDISEKWIEFDVTDDVLAFLMVQQIMVHHFIITQDAPCRINITAT